jgi:hypothetical protein
LAVALFLTVGPHQTHEEHMTKINPEYKILPAWECDQYIIKHGEKLQNFSRSISIPSKAGAIYSLSNGEFVLVPNSKPDYPGFIFRDFAAFKKYLDMDFFPIPVKDMTWLEAHVEEMRHWNVIKDFIYVPLKTNYKVQLPFKTVDDIKTLFDKVGMEIRENDWDSADKVSIMYCLALAVIDYLNSIKHYRLEMVGRYATYNPYFEPIIILPNRAKVNVVDLLFIVMDDYGSSSFDSFKYYSGL